MEIVDSFSSHEPTPQVMNFTFRLPHRLQMTLSPEGLESLTMCIVDSVSIMETRDAALQRADTIASVFDRLHKRLEVIVDGLVGTGSNFKQRYEKLPQTNDWEIILAQTYRVFTVFRNAANHHANSIVVTNTSVEAVFTTPQGTLCEIKMDGSGFELLATICEIFRTNPQRHPYTEALLRSYFNEFVGKAQSFSDVHQTPFASVNGQPRLKRIRRVLITNPEFEVDGTSVRIQKYVPKNPETKFEWEEFDYLVTHNGKNYHVPEEALEPSFELALSDLGTWTPVSFSAK